MSTLGQCLAQVVDVALEAADLRLDWTKVQNWKSAMISGFNRGIAGLVKGNKVAVKSGAVKFTGPREAEIESASGKET
ncbi:MAG: hypothetical protein IH907_10995, partial [Proteobacteria bacterium]|nr:hypothetical protein [Pseudomonadota bacterium]